jgi:molybdopterin converting factor small subunit
MTVVHVRYFAGARAAAGVAEESISATTLEQLLAIVGTRDVRLEGVLAASSFLIDGLAAHDRSALLPEGCVVDVLPPFAGG